MCMFIVGLSHATVCFCMFLVGYPQTPEPVIPLVDWHKLTYLVLTCRKTPINQSINQLSRWYYQLNARIECLYTSIICKPVVQCWRRYIYYRCRYWYDVCRRISSLYRSSSQNSLDILSFVNMFVSRRVTMFTSRVLLFFIKFICLNKP